MGKSENSQAGKYSIYDNLSKSVYFLLTVHIQISVKSSRACMVTRSGGQVITTSKK